MEFITASLVFKKLTSLRTLLHLRLDLQEAEIAKTAFIEFQFSD